MNIYFIILLALALHIVFGIITYKIMRQKGYEKDEAFIAGVYGLFGIYAAIRLKGIEE
jgi:hypothetical protein